MTTYPQDTPALRQSIIDACRWMNASGLNQGTSGNISVRLADAVLVTPSGIPYDKMEPDTLQKIPLTGALETSQGPFRPTTEWRFHQAILQQRSEMVAVVHAHPTYATSLAVQRRHIPACHYMIAAFGGNDVPLVDYALFGSAKLADMVCKAMVDRSACLMANHGALCAGETLERALWRMEELENLAKVYQLSLTTGEPVILDDTEMNEVIAEFANYGPRS